MALHALVFVLGVWGLQSLPALPGFIWLFLLPATIGVAFILRRSIIGRSIFLYFFFFLAGFFWAACFAHARLADALPPEWEGQKITLVGVVASMPQQQERGERFEFDVERVLTPGAVVPRHISLSQFSTEFNLSNRLSSQSRIPKLDFHAGERWQLVVKLKRPHGTANPYGFDFEAWALERNIRATGYIQKNMQNQRLHDFVSKPGYLVERLRENTRRRMQAALATQPYAGVLQALAIGDENAISAEDWQLFQNTGTTHLMSISGLHITMLSGLVLGLVYAAWRRVPTWVLKLPARKAAVLAGVATAFLYAMFSGFSVPAQRTLYMLLVFALAIWLGRPVAFRQVLAYALLVVVLLDPWAVLAAGFWLSFGAVAILAYAMGGKLQRPHWLREAVHSQWVVTIGMLPLLLVLFQQVSLISPVANALAIPIVSLLVVPLTLLGSLLPIDSALWLAHELMRLCMQFLHCLDDIPVSTWQQHAPPVWTLPLALLGVLWVLMPRGFPSRYLGVTFLLPMLLITPTGPEHGAMKVTVLDVGQGLAVVVETSQHQLLYDTGPRYSSQSDSGSRIIVPFLRGKGLAALDGLIVSHHDTDHSGGMRSVLGRVPVGWLAGSLPAGAEELQKHHQILCFGGQHWEWDGVEFDMLYPSFDSYTDDTLKDNDRSCVLKINSKHGSLLLTGDIERRAEAKMLETLTAQLSSDVLVVPHHGSKTSSTHAFVDAVKPHVAIFTVGYRNRFGHPKPMVVERYRDAGSRLYRSDYDGALQLDFSNNQQISIRRWRDERQRYWSEKPVAW